MSTDFPVFARLEKLIGFYQKHQNNGAEMETAIMSLSMDQMIRLEFDLGLLSEVEMENIAAGPLNPCTYRHSLDQLTVDSKNSLTEVWIAACAAPFQSSSIPL